jgi:2-dehydro-3-deoxygalactonokinase
MSTPAFLAVDWGTTNLRAWLVDEAGRVLAGRDFPALGVSRLGPGEVAARFADTVRPALKAHGLPSILCGMVGSNLGWESVPYLDCPADLKALARGLHRVDTPGAPVWIVPGLRARRLDGAPDVMRGEEVQVLGWAATAGAAAAGARLVCHPGTHAKWVRLVDGRIERFVTAMTGELFDILRKHSVLRQPVASEDEAAFDAGQDAAGDGGALAARLFTARSRVVGGDMPPPAATSYLSGLLIGAEVASLPALAGAQAHEPVVLIGSPPLCARYQRALDRRGVHAIVHDGDEAVLAGLTALFLTERVR